MPRYDLIMHGVTVLDPANGFEDVSDVGIVDGRIDRVEPELDQADADDVIDGGDGTDTIYERGNSDYDLADDQLVSDSGTAVLASIDLAFIKGGDGHNILDAADFTGDVTLNGGNGNDTLLGSEWADIIRGGTARDLIHGGNHHNRTHGQRNRHTSDSGEGDDEIHGNAGNDLITGGGGDAACA